MRGREVPVWVIRAVLGVLLLALAALHAGDAWGWIAALAAVVGSVTPWVQLTWVAMLSLALSELTQPAGAGAWQPYAVLVGVTFAHVLASRAAVTPLAARVELRVFSRPLLVALAVVVPCAGLLALALWLRAADLPHWVPAGLIAALALLALGALLFARLLRRTD